MKIIQADRTKITISDYKAQSLVYAKFELIPERVNRYKYMTDIYCARLN